MIEAVHLSKQFGTVRAVDDVSFTIRPGRVTGFLGPNGAGKTTTMRMIMGLDRPTRGNVTIAGCRYQQIDRPLCQVGAVLDASATHRGRSAYHHLLWLARSNRIPTQRVRDVLAMVGLENVARRRVGGFSLGMSQRLGLAAALLGDPPVLLLDEPTNGLDPEGVSWLRDLLRDLAGQGRTVFVSSHLMDEMARIADHLIVFAGGRLMADTTVERLVAELAGAFVRIRTPEPARMRELLATAGIQASSLPDGTVRAETADAATIGELAASGGVTIHEISARTGSLEEAFMRLTSGLAARGTGGPR